MNTACYIYQVPVFSVSLLLFVEIGKLIKILCAFYGIDPQYHCDGFSIGAPTSCFGSDSGIVITTLCQGRRSCLLSSDYQPNAGFEDLCNSWVRVLLIQWQCVDDPMQTTTAMTSLRTLPFCQTYLTPDGTCPTTSPYFPSFVTFVSIDSNTELVLIVSFRLDQHHSAMDTPFSRRSSALAVRSSYTAHSAKSYIYTRPIGGFNRPRRPNAS